MTRRIILAAGLGFAACAGIAQAQGVLQPGQRMQVAGGLGQGTVQQVMIAPDGGSIDIVYAMPAGAPESRRVLRLENVNGMLEVVYDTAMPQARTLGTGGIPRLIAKGEGMYEVAYDGK